ncbi:MAG: hypothetical protein IK124_06245 [Prevotella sp.]|nr:hypothetical protein [Prevotella sp.]
MKKSYIAPEVKKVFYCDAIMEGINPQSVMMQGNVPGENDATWGPGGEGHTGDNPDAKQNGRGFWDDED